MTHISNLRNIVYCPLKSPWQELKPHRFQLSLMFHPIVHTVNKLVLRELALGVYKGKMSFQIKPIHHKIGDYALLAAIEQGKSWELFEAYANVEGRLDETGVLKAAKEAKLDVARLKKSVNDKSATYKKMIDLNYAEAKKNDMNFTPTLYFNGYMYKSNKHPIWIMEYIDFLLQQKKK